MKLSRGCPKPQEMGTRPRRAVPVLKETGSGWCGLDAAGCTLTAQPDLLATPLWDPRGSLDYNTHPADSVWHTLHISIHFFLRFRRKFVRFEIIVIVFLVQSNEKSKEEEEEEEKEEEEEVKISWFCLKSSVADVIMTAGWLALESDSGWLVPGSWFCGCGKSMPTPWRVVDAAKDPVSCRTITAPSWRHHSFITASSVHHHSIIRAPSQLRHSFITAPSRLRQGTIRAPSRLRHGPIRAPSRLRHGTIGHHHGFVTASSGYHHGFVTVPSGAHHSFIMTPSGHHHGFITAPSGHHHSTIRAPSRLRHSFITAPSGHHHSFVTAPSGHHHGTIRAPSQNHQGTITASSQLHHGTIRASSRHRQGTITCCLSKASEVHPFPLCGKPQGGVTVVGSELSWAQWRRTVLATAGQQRWAKLSEAEGCSTPTQWEPAATCSPAATVLVWQGVGRCLVDSVMLYVHRNRIICLLVKMGRWGAKGGRGVGMRVRVYLPATVMDLSASRSFAIHTRAIGE